MVLSMQDQRIEEETVEDGARPRNHEQAVLHLLLGEHLPWTVEEIVREVSCSNLAAVDAVAGLAAAGLVHRFGDFVFPTRTARRADEIDVA
jgi:hypothetical protein